MFSSPAAFIGFLVGGGVPVIYGIYMLGAHYAYTASSRPGEAACGMAGLAGFGLILVVGPIGSMAGLTVGALTTWLWNCIRRAVISGAQGN